MKTEQVIALAAKHVDNGAAMQSSAALCLAEARTLLTLDERELAHRRALKSLGYSVGIFHPDYNEALK